MVHLYTKKHHLLFSLDVYSIFLVCSVLNVKSQAQKLQCGEMVQWFLLPSIAKSVVTSLFFGGHSHLFLGNIQLATCYSVLVMAGLSPNRLILAGRHMGLSVISPRCYFKHQQKYLFPIITGYWKKMRDSLVGKMCEIEKVTLSGDGRFDSVGHSAKYCSYSMFCNKLGKIVHFEIIQVRKNYIFGK